MMTTDFLAPPDARPKTPRALSKGWAQDMLARCAGAPVVVERTHAAAKARRSASGRPAGVAPGGSTQVGRRSARLTLPKPQAG